jgi:hypothetical protein
MTRHEFLPSPCAAADGRPGRGPGRTGLGVRGGRAVDDAVAALQHDWEVIRYQSPPRSAKSASRRWRRSRTSQRDLPARAEPLIWEGIIVSSWAGEKGAWARSGWSSSQGAL